MRFADITDGLSQTLAVGERPPPDTFQAGGWYSRGVPPTLQWGRSFYGPDEQLPVHSFAVGGDPCLNETGFVFGPGHTENPCDRYHFWSLHPRGANFLFADGSVRFYPHSSRQLLPALATRAGGETVAVPD